MRVILSGRNPQLFDNRRRRVHEAPDHPVGFTTRTLCGRKMVVGGPYENWVQTDDRVDCKGCLKQAATSVVTP